MQPLIIKICLHLQNHSSITSCASNSEPSFQYISRSLRLCPWRDQPSPVSWERVLASAGTGCLCKLGSTCSSSRTLCSWCISGRRETSGWNQEYLGGELRTRKILALAICFFFIYAQTKLSIHVYIFFTIFFIFRRGKANCLCAIWTGIRRCFIWRRWVESPESYLF